jgi:hypothetical protein
MMQQGFRAYKGRIPLAMSGYQVRDLDGRVLFRIEYYGVPHAFLCTIAEDPMQSGGEFVARSLQRYGVDPRTVLMTPFQTYER